MKPVAVIGAGLAGLSAAHELMRAGLDVVVFEHARRAGGVIVSERIGAEWLAEGGPDSYLAADQEIPDLARELGIVDRIVRQAARGSLSWDGKVLVPLPEGDAATLLGIQVRKEDLAAGHATFAGGMGDCIAALERRVGSALRLEAGVESLEAVGGGFRLGLADASVFEAAAVVAAVPAHRAAHLLRSLSAAAGEFLQGVPYTPSLTVSLGYRAEQVHHPLDGTGFVVAAAAGVPLRACTYASRKFPGRAPAGHVLLRAFLAPGLAEAARAAHHVLARILDIVGEPLWHRVYDWPLGLPAYGEDHVARLALVRTQLSAAGPLVLAGAGYDGSGVSACIRSGRAAARDVERRLAAATA